jgi:hypothetical protein
VALWAGHHAGPTSKVKVALGDDTFNAGPAKERAAEVADRGPLLFPGLVDQDKGYIVVNHRGSDDLSGWVAFSAVAPGSSINCAVQWRTDSQQFQDPCTSATFPPDGTGLTHYAVSISPDRDIVIDLGRGSTTTTAG